MSVARSVNCQVNNTQILSLCFSLIHLAFQKIFQAPRGGQLKITGNIVNVPADVNSTVNMLPRLPDETGTIKVQLKRRLQYKSSAFSLNIRPHKVMQAAAWLVNTSPLYEGQGITIDQNWLRSLPVSADETCDSIETQNDADDRGGFRVRPVSRATDVFFAKKY